LLVFSLPADVSDSALLLKYTNQLESLMRSGERLVVDVRDYVAELLFKRREAISFASRDDLVQKVYSRLRGLRSRVLSSTQTSLSSVKDYHVFSFTLGKEDAITLLSGYGIKDTLFDQALRYAGFKHVYPGVYFPGLLVEAANKIRGGEELDRVLDGLERSETMMTLRLSLATSTLEGLVESSKTQLARLLAGVSASLGPIASSALVAVTVFAGFFGFATFSEKDFKRRLVESAAAWRKLPEEKRVILADIYDRQLGLLPGESKEILDELFLHDENLEKQVYDAWQKIRSLEAEKIYEGILAQKNPGIALAAKIRQSGAEVNHTTNTRKDEVKEFREMIESSRKEVCIWRGGFSSASELINLFTTFLNRDNTMLRILLSVNQFTITNARPLIELSKKYGNLELGFFESSLRAEIYDRETLRIVTKAPRQPRIVDDPGKPGEDTEFYYASWCTKHKDWVGFALNFFEYCWQKADHDLDAIATTIHELTHLDNESTY